MNTLKLTTLLQQRNGRSSPTYVAESLDESHVHVSFCFSLEEETKPWLESGGKPEVLQTKPNTYEVVSSRISVVYKPTTQEESPVLPQVIKGVISA